MTAARTSASSVALLSAPSSRRSRLNAALISELLKRGYRLRPQVPVAGYRLDFVVEELIERVSRFFWMDLRFGDLTECTEMVLAGQIEEVARYCESDDPPARAYGQALAQSRKCRPAMAGCSPDTRARYLSPTDF
jgi:hypothetical protein